MATLRLLVQDLIQWWLLWRGRSGHYKSQSYSQTLHVKHKFFISSGKWPMAISFPALPSTKKTPYMILPPCITVYEKLYTFILYPLGLFDDDFATTWNTRFCDRLEGLSRHSDGILAKSINKGSPKKNRGYVGLDDVDVEICPPPPINLWFFSFQFQFFLREIQKKSWPWLIFGLAWPGRFSDQLNRPADFRPRIFQRSWGPKLFVRFCLFKDMKIWWRHCGDSHSETSAWKCLNGGT